METIYQVISYYPSKDEIVIKNFRSEANAYKEHDAVVEDFRGMYGKNVMNETTMVRKDILIETRLYLADYYANAYSCVKKLEV